MTLRTAPTVVRAGIDVTGVIPTAGTGDTFANDGSQIFIVKNGSAAPINVTVDYTATADGNAVTDPVVAVAAGVDKAFGPYPPGLYNDGSGLVKITCSAVTDVLLACLKQSIGT